MSNSHIIRRVPGKLNLRIPKRQNEVDNMDRNEMPLGFGFALAQNPEAMMNFANLPEPQRSAVLERAHTASSKYEMQSVVNELASMS